MVAAVGLVLCSQNQIIFAAQAVVPKVIENPETPKYSGRDAPELVFKQELSIPLVGRRYSFDVDEAGNIYLLESLEGSITVYDKDGKIIRQFGKKGQGPGEFENSVYLSVSPEKKIYVLDRPRKVIQIFDMNGKWLERRQLLSVGMMNNLKFDSGGCVYIQDMRNLFALKDEERIKRGVAGLSRLQKFNSRFEKIMDVEIWDNRFLKRAQDVGYNYLLYHDIFYYQIDPNNCLYYGDSSRYEIRQTTSDGQLKKIIKKKGRRIPTAKQDLANLMKDFPELKEQDTEMSETKPFFLDFHVLNKIGLLVGTYVNDWNSKGILNCDLFDQDGVYIAKVKVPRYYYSKDQDSISEQRNRLFKNGRCYSLVYNEKDEALELVRHSVELKWPQPKPGRSVLDTSGRWPR
jgi:hypothetical protein